MQVFMNRDKIATHLRIIGTAIACSAHELKDEDNNSEGYLSAIDSIQDSLKDHLSDLTTQIYHLGSLREEARIKLYLNKGPT